MPTLKERIRGDALLEAISNGKVGKYPEIFRRRARNGSYGARTFFIDDAEWAEWKSLRRAETPGALFAQFSLYLTE